MDDKISPFEKVAREKNDELKEYKKGYDYSKNKSIIDGVIETIEFIETAEKKVEIKDEILRSYFSTTKDKLIIILSNSGIEHFKPKLNSQSLDDHGCEVDVNTEKTDDEKKNNLIYQVLKDGYKIQLTDSKTKIVRKALVKVYEFKKNNDNINQRDMSKIFGIDLGTTFSAIAELDDLGNPEVLSDPESGNRITRSVVYFGKDKVIVGEKAKDAAVTKRDKVV